MGIFGAVEIAWAQDFVPADEVLIPNIRLTFVEAGIASDSEAKSAGANRLLNP